MKDKDEKDLQGSGHDLKIEVPWHRPRRNEKNH